MKEAFLSNYLQKEARKSLVTCLAWIMVALALLVAGTAAGVTFIILPGAVIFVISILVVTRRGPIYATYRYGVHGERVLRAHLLSSGLSDEYTAYYNFPVNGNGGIFDIDCILVGPSGVYVFEVKHHHGLILHRNGNWARIKVGRRGTPYRGQLGNPSHQLSRTIRKLKELLGQAHVDGLWLHGAIIFTNPRAALDIGELRWVKAVAVKDLNQVLSGRMTLSTDQTDRVKTCLAAFAK
jgi:Nuclease-related domain